MRQNLKRFWLGFLCAFVLVQGSTQSILSVQAAEADEAIVETTTVAEEQTTEPQAPESETLPDDPVPAETTDTDNGTDVETEQNPNAPPQEEGTVDKNEMEEDTKEEEEEEEEWNQAPITGNASHNGVTVNVNAPAGSFPEGTNVTIQPLDNQVAQGLRDQVTEGEEAIGFDISFITAEGSEVQPSNGQQVTVGFTVDAASPLTIEDDETATLDVVHVSNQGGGEILKSVDAPQTGQSSDIVVYANSFSAYLVSKSPVLKAPQEAKMVDVAITNFTIENLEHEAADRIYYNDRFYLAMDWDASSYGKDLHAGDYFDVTLPDNMIFPAGVTASDFNLTDDEGNVVATAHVTPGPNNAGGTIHVEFTDAVEDRYNVKGTMYVAAQFNRQAVTYNEPNTFTVTVNGEVNPISASTEATVVGPKQLEDEILGKWGQSVANVDDQAEWWVRINHRQDTLTNVVITDSLAGTGEHFLPETFTLRKVTYNEYGGVVGSATIVDVSSMISFSDDLTSFTLNLGNIDGDQYQLSYRSTYTPGTRLRNRVVLNSTETSQTFVATHISAQSGGSGGGDLASRIKITKVDADDNTIVLAGAVFEVEDSQGNKFTLTTGADGTVTSDTLTQGTYHVREIQAPTGYMILDSESEFDLEVTPSGGAIRTVKNQKNTIDIPVNKQWIGPAADSVTVTISRSYESGGNTTEEALSQTLVLNEANNWSGTFTDLEEYAPNGTKYTYQVQEQDLNGYRSEIVDNGGSFTIINTNTETIDIPVVKQWIGPPAEDVEIRLYSNGEKIDSVVLSDANQWQHTFTGLPKYDANSGAEIPYDIVEATTKDFHSRQEGDFRTGFTVYNYNTETVDIPVTKQWVGPQQASVDVQLMADNQTADTITLSAANNWSHVFTGLPKYDETDGHEIEYTVEETPIENYKVEIAGDAQNGFSIINTNIETISIPVQKQWVGTPTDYVDIQLMADGTMVDTISLSADNDWAYTFTELPKYDETDGHEIEYTVEETAVEGYTTGISGTAGSGFTITNTITGKVSVPVTKKWVGTPTDSVTIQLFADGKQIDSVVLNKDNQWQYTFTDLDQYKDGKEITYTIQEEAVKGYKVTYAGNAKEGFIVTNTQNTPKKEPKKKDPTKQKGLQTGVQTNQSTPIVFGVIIVALLICLAVYIYKRSKKNQ